MTQPRKVMVKDQIDAAYKISRQGTDMVLYAGLLDRAHQEGLKRITTKLIQAPTPENGGTAICWAEVEMDHGTFSGIGDANDTNVGRPIVPHKIRMAETRAKGRALRDALNMGGMVTKDEMGPDVDDQPAPRTGANRTTGEMPPKPAPLHPAPVPTSATPEQTAHIDKLIARCRQLDPDFGITRPEQLGYEAAAEMILNLIEMGKDLARTKTGMAR